MGQVEERDEVLISYVRAAVVVAQREVVLSASHQRGDTDKAVSNLLEIIRRVYNMCPLPFR